MTLDTGILTVTGTTGIAVPSCLYSMTFSDPAVCMVARSCVLMTLDAGYLLHVTLKAFALIYLARITMTVDPACIMTGRFLGAYSVSNKRCSQYG